MARASLGRALVAAAALLASLAAGGWWLVVRASPSGAAAGSRRPAPASSAPVGPPGLIRFEDLTPRSGIRFRHDRASAGRRYFVETMGAGVAVLDYDGDGLPDLFFLNGAPLPGYRPRTPMRPALYRNLGGGRFEEKTAEAGLDFESYGMGCAVGDFDNDGRDDLYVTAVLGPNRLFRNLGNGRFADVTRTAGVDNGSRFSSSAAWLDYDKDGDLDLYVANYVRYNSVKDDLPCYFKEGVRSYCIPFAYAAEPNALYRNDGNGRFTDVSRTSGADRPAGKSLAVGIGDYDGDTWPDIFVANDTTPTQLFRNNRDGTFTEIAAEVGIAYGPAGTAKAGMGIDLADDQNSGGFSVAMGNFSSEMVGYYQTSGGFFEERSIAVGLGQPSRSFLTFGTLFLDADNDGWKDLVLANGHVQDNVELFYKDIQYRQHALLFRNIGNSRYEDASAQAGPPFSERIVGRGLARLDLDNDGRMDLVVTENNGPPRLWRNTTEGGGHWLQLRLRGVRSNRNGYGSRISLAAGPLRHVTELQSGASYLSASDQRVHLGLGAATKADRIEIAWPSGVVDVLRDLPAGRLVTVIEGRGAESPARTAQAAAGPVRPPVSRRHSAPVLH